MVDGKCGTVAGSYRLEAVVMKESSWGAVPLYFCQCS